MLKALARMFKLDYRTSLKEAMNKQRKASLSIG